MKAKIVFFLIVSAAMVLSSPAARAQEGTGPVATATAPATAESSEPVNLGGEIVPAATVDEALNYTPAERNILSAVRDGGTWNTTAFYVLLRRAAMLPEGPATLDQAEQPNPRDFWKEPQRYRGRLVRFEGSIPRPIAEWTGNLTGTDWWGSRPVYMVDVMEETTGQPMLVAMVGRPHGNIFLKQKLRFAGIFYKLVTLSENSKSGDPNVTHEYPLIVARQFYSSGPPARDNSWTAVVIVLPLAALTAAFFLLRQRNRRIIRTDALGQERRRREVPSEYENAPVDEELLRQIAADKEAQDKRPGGRDDAD